MKETRKTKHQEELLRLYNPEKTPSFKVVRATKNKSPKQTTSFSQIKPLTLSNLLISLLLTFFLVFIQLVIARSL